jgi:hypothetical protein
MAVALFRYILIICISTSVLYAQKINRKDLIGTWHLVKEGVNYPTAILKQSVIFTSKGDTVYQYGYSLKGNDITFIDMFEEQFKNSILLVNEDTLVFEQLFQNKITRADTSHRSSL